MIEATACHLHGRDDHVGQILVGRRVKPPFPGALGAPGGKYELEENMISCATRETMDEVSVVPIILQHNHFATAYYYYPDANGVPECKWCVHFIDVYEWEGEPELPHQKEFSELVWIRLRNMPYKDMMPDFGHWFPKVLSEGLDKILLVQVRYADPTGQKIEAVETTFV
jgi:ADP-ribose pyrophosphatase YjhB (NUDIX family)